MRVIIHNELHPEDNAMLASLYSRSPASVLEHIKKVTAAGSGKFMEQYYVGYGHQSIGDCGNITVYFEDISMLAAKAIEDDPLFSGQESSSRYIDWSNQPFSLASDFDSATPEAQILDQTLFLTSLRKFYVDTKPKLIEHLKIVYPIKPDEEPKIYNKAIEARAFDILRGFLPAGATTNVAYTGSLRDVGTHIEKLLFHPLNEVKMIAQQAYLELANKYPNSFKPGVVACITKEGGGGWKDEYLNYVSDHRNFYDIDSFNTQLKKPISGVSMRGSQLICPYHELDDELMPYRQQDRPKYQKFMRHGSFGNSFNVPMTANLDFGSFRDLQRHRRGYCSMPVLTTKSGFHSWYLDSLPITLRSEAISLLKRVSELANSMTIDNCLKEQYIIPMGFKVEVNLVYDIPQMVYVAELRSGNTVHATLRPIAQQMANVLNEMGIKTYHDNSADPWSIRRGSQDIVEKEQVADHGE